MLTKSLVQKYYDQKIAHFYILSSTGPCEEQKTYLKKWYRNLVHEILKIENLDRGRSSQQIFDRGHEDVLVITTENKSYTVNGGEFEEFFSFLKYKSLHLKRKIIFVTDAHKLNETLSNKLLKTLERPPVETTIFFLNPNSEKFLQTIESRAIKLRLHTNTPYTQLAHPIKGLEQWLSEAEETKESLALKKLVTRETGLANFIDLIKSKSLQEDKILLTIARWANETNQSGEKVSAIIENLKFCEDQAIYNGAVQNRLAVFLENTIL